mgnify:CR=1 FL=1
MTTCDSDFSPVLPGFFILKWKRNDKSRGRVRGPHMKNDFDPDVTHRDETPYWAAKLALAIRCGDRARVAEARRQLKRLGCPLDIIETKPNSAKRRKGANRE